MSVIFDYFIPDLPVIVWVYILSVILEYIIPDLPVIVWVYVLSVIPEGVEGQGIWPWWRGGGFWRLWRGLWWGGQSVSGSNALT